MLSGQFRMMRDQPSTATETITPPGFLRADCASAQPESLGDDNHSAADYGPMLADPVDRFVVIAGSFVMVQLCFHSLWYGGSWIMRMISTDRGRLFFSRVWLSSLWLWCYGLS